MKTVNGPQVGQTDLVPIESQPLAVAPAGGLTIEQVFAAVVEKQISPENIAVMKELLAMSAERKFAEAFVALQRDLPVIVATTVIQNRGRYERFEDVMHAIAPHLSKHGFTVSFAMDSKDNRMIATCHLSHTEGHTRSNSFPVRTGKADSDTQADCKAATTAKRNALCNALNIVIRQDAFSEENDPNSEGANITAEQAREIRQRVINANRDQGRFLDWLGAKTFEDIKTGVLPEIEDFLVKAERIAMSKLGK